MFDPLLDSKEEGRSSKTVCQLQADPRSFWAETVSLVPLPSEAASLGKTSLSSSWCAQDGAAVGAGDHGLAVAEHCCDIEASLALDVHEVAVRRLNQSLELVLGLLELLWRVQEIDIAGQDHSCCRLRSVLRPLVGEYWAEHAALCVPGRCEVRGPCRSPGKGDDG